MDFYVFVNPVSESNAFDIHGHIYVLTPRSGLYQLCIARVCNAACDVFKILGLMVLKKRISKRFDP